MKNRWIIFVSLLMVLLLSVATLAACKKEPENTNPTPQDNYTPEIEVVVDPYNVDSEGIPLAKPTISLARIDGDYQITGTKTTYSATGEKLEETAISFHMNVLPSGDGLVVFTILDGEKLLEAISENYNSETGICSFTTADGDVFNVKFTENDDKIISVSMSSKTIYDSDYSVTSCGGLLEQ